LLSAQSVGFDRYGTLLNSLSPTTRSCGSLALFETRSAEGMIAKKEMFEARGKSFQHGTRIALAHGGEQGHYTPTYDRMVHNDLPIRARKNIVS
jgi:hypothetical protein